MQATDFFPQVQAPSREHEVRARELVEALGPGGCALGRMGDVAAWLSACQSEVPAKPVEDVRLVVFAGDHGVASRGVSGLPAGMSVQFAHTIAEGGSGVQVAAQSAGAIVRVVDVALDHDTFGDERVSRACGCIDVEDAMSVEQCQRAVEIGMRIADQEVDSGADLLVVGDVGAGSTTTAAVLVGTFARSEPVVVVGRGSGIDDEAWKLKVAAVRDAMFRVRSVQTDIFEVLRRVGSPELVALAAFMAQAAVRRTPVVIDGVTSAAAAIAADRMAPGTRKWLIAGHKTTEPSHELALNYLSLDPILDARINVGGGVGACMAVPFIKVASRYLSDAH